MGSARIAMFVGIAASYSEYRHGNSRPVYDPSKTTKAKKLSGQRREHVVSRIVEIMSNWTSTPFEHEGHCRHGIRSGLCIEGGTTWTRADIEASAIVEEALRRLRARRPSWEEGQWAHTQSPDRCAWCSGEIDEEERTRSQRFCSASCARSALEHMARKSNTYGGSVIRSAYRLVAKQASAPKDCEHCGKTFRSDVPGARFCSIKCGSRAGALARGLELREDRSCLECGTNFHPGHRDQQYCSHACDTTARHRAERERLADEIRACGCCGEQFTPTVEKSMYCSPRCASTMANRAYRARKGYAEHHHNCRWCGEHFVSKMPWAEFCSKEHRALAQGLLAAKRPKPLTAPAFDYLITLPVNMARPTGTTLSAA